jgi:hypothetical protein
VAVFRFRALLAVSILCGGCAAVDRRPETTTVPPVAAAPTVELGESMGELQRFTDKLGYAVAARNRELAKFYVAETFEALWQIARDVPEHDGYPVGSLVGIIAEPALRPLEASLLSGEWEQVESGYREHLESCNRCHRATGHEFIVVTPPPGTPPYGQKF